MKKKILLIIFVILAFSLGIIFEKKKGSMQSFRMKKTVLSLKGNKMLILSNFESADDLKKWNTVNASLKQYNGYNSEGKTAGKMVFAGNIECSNVMLDRFFSSHPEYGDWSNFNQLRFDIYNPANDTLRLMLKIKDRNGKAWQRNMYLAAKQNTEIKIYIDELKNTLDTSSIKQFNLFRWNPKEEAVFYIDNLRLMPADKSQEESISLRINNDKLISDKKDSDFSIGVETAINKVFRDPAMFQGEIKDTLEISLAGNEYESTQLVIYAKKQLQNVRVGTGSLVAIVDGKETHIDKNNIKCYKVGYVETKKPYYNTNFVGLWPDPLEEKDSFNIEENTVQPIWIEVYCPASTPAGEYTGQITLQFNGTKTRNIKLKVKVWGFSLPQTATLKTAFGFFDNRLRKMYPKEDGENQPIYDSRMYELKRKYYLDMIKHKIMPICNFDLDSIFTIKDIEFYVDRGLNSFAIGKYGSSFGNNWPKEEEKLEAIKGLYREYARILKANNLIDKAYIYTFDEPEYGNYFVDKITKLIHEADPELKNMIAFHLLANPDAYPEWGRAIDIFCIRNAIFNEKVAKTFRERGKELWIYVSSPEWPYPALVIDFPAISYRIIPWMCWKYQIKGYLYWCVNFWEDNPWKNPTSKKFGQNGNGFLYYPGENVPVASIRLKVTRDGIEDYEYFTVLKEELEKIKNSVLTASNPDLIKRAQELLNIDPTIVNAMDEYTKKPETILQQRAKIAAVIEELKRLNK